MPRVLFLCFLLTALVRPIPGGEPAYLSPCDILADRDGAVYLLEAGAARLRRLSERDGAADEVLPLPVEPVRMAFTPDRTRIAVVGGVGEGKLLLVRVRDEAGRPVPPEIVKSFPAGHSPSCAAALMREGTKA